MIECWLLLSISCISYNLYMHCVINLIELFFIILLKLTIVFTGSPKLIRKRSHITALCIEVLYHSLLIRKVILKMTFVSADFQHWILCKKYGNVLSKWLMYSNRNVFQFKVFYFILKRSKVARRLNAFNNAFNNAF